jgi:hypothetical protein
VIRHARKVSVVEDVVEDGPSRPYIGHIEGHIEHPSIGDTGLFATEELVVRTPVMELL